jgi:hypothetical protein
MKTFFTFIEEQAAPIKSRGISAERHTKQYITPYLPGGAKHAEGTHTIASDHGEFKSGDKVTIHGHEVVDGVHHAVVSKVGSNTKTKIPTNKLIKPTTRKNKGLAQEASLVTHLNSHGLMHGEGAGSTAGNDFHLVDKRGKKHSKISGSEGINTSSESGIHGEHKSDIKTTAFGQITLSRHPKTGKWQIDDKARAKRPEYAAHVEKATITVNGKKKKILDHLNETEPHGTTNKSGFHSDETKDLEPAHSYMRDHHVDVVHIDSHGTFNAGHSSTTDRHKTGLPNMEGNGRFRVRQKTDNPNKRTVQFEIRKLNKSNVNIGTSEGASEMKKRLGH